MEYYEDLIENCVNEEDNLNFKTRDDKKQNKTENHLNFFSYKKKIKGFYKDKYYDKLNVKINFYSSGDIGSKIKNALTGETTNFKVGSLDENLFFIVTIPSHLTGSQPLKIFYETPEEYEKSHYVELTEKIKKKWHEKNTKYKIDKISKNS